MAGEWLSEDGMHAWQLEANRRGDSLEMSRQAIPFAGTALMVLTWHAAVHGERCLHS